MPSKEIPKEESRKQENIPTKKVYLTPGEFLWDNYKRGERLMREKDKGIKRWKEINLNGGDQQLSMMKALEDTIEDQEVKFTKRQIKTILKNFNNTAKAIRNINRVLKEVL